MALNPIERIGQIGQPVKRLDTAVPFYRDLLGFTLLFEVGSMAFFDVGGLRLMLGVPEREEHAHPGSVLYLQTADIDGTYESLQAQGVEFLGAPHLVAKVGDTETWMAFFRDTEGNTLALMSEKPA